VCCSVLQCVAVRCCVLQCVAVCCSVLQCVAVCLTHDKFEARHTHVTHTHTNTHTGKPAIQAHTHTSHARHTYVKANVTYIIRVSNEMFVLQHITTHCNILQRTATYCTSHTLHTRVTSKSKEHPACVG